jgi:hypothetical protein
VIPFRKGDRVKLTQHEAKRQKLEHQKYSYRFRDDRRNIDWFNRKGTVNNNPIPGTVYVSIRWDNQTTSERWHSKFIELVMEKEHEQNSTRLDESLST